MLSALSRTAGRRLPSWTRSPSLRSFSEMSHAVETDERLVTIRSDIESHKNFSAEFKSTGQFKKYFSTPPANKNIQEVREGGYVENREIDEFLPEGLAGELSAEFQASGNMSWMIRDGSKLLCRLIDEYSAVSNQSKPVKLPQNLVQPVDVPGLTDRKEWPNAEMSVKYYGKELYDPTRTRHNGFEVSQGEGSPVEKCMGSIKAIDSGVPTKIMLLGPRGVGKSAMLNQAVVHARSKGWLCMFVPEGWDQVQSGAFIEPVPSTGDLPLFDNSWMSAEVLRGFWRAHGPVLRDIPLKNAAEMSKYNEFLKDFEEQWTRAKSVPGRDKFNYIRMREMVYGEDTFGEQDQLDEDVLANFDISKFKFENLEDLCLMGVALRDLAGPLVLDLVAELRQLESHKVLFAVDHYNTWEGPTAFHYNKKPVLGKQLCVPHALNFISKKKIETEAWTLKNGMCIAASSLKHPEGRKYDYENYKPSIPLSITVPCYSRVEFLSAISYYTDSKVIPDDVDLNRILSYRMMTGSTGRLARELAIPYFFPKAVDAHSQSLNLNILTSSTNADGSSIFGAGDADFFDGGDDDDDDWGADDDDEAATEPTGGKKKPPQQKKSGKK